MLEKLKELSLRYESLETQLTDPAVYGDTGRLAAVNRELRELKPVVEAYRAYLAAERRREDAEALLHDPGAGPGGTGGEQGGGPAPPPGAHRPAPAEGPQ